MDGSEGKFLAGDAKGGIELLNGLAVCQGIVQMNLPVAMRVSHGTTCLNEKIGPAGDGIVVSGKRLQDAKVDIVNIGAKIEITAAGDVAVVQAGGGIEADGSVVALQSGTAQSNGCEGNLKRGRKRIPMTLQSLSFRS